MESDGCHFVIQMSRGIEYSERYSDGSYEYRQVVIPRELAAELKTQGLLTEAHWRAMGITQSRGWVHYDVHKPEPHVLLFRRPLGTDPKTGLVDAKLKAQVEEEATARLKAYGLSC